MPGQIVLFGGPAGAGKSTLARRWAAARPRAVHIELDDVRGLIVGGLADPQRPSELQTEQYEIAVSATCRLARSFSEAGYDVAIGDALEPAAFERCWLPDLDGLDLHVIVVLPSLEQTLARSTARRKRVLEEHTREQHARSSGWPAERRIDTTGLSVEESLRLVDELLAAE